MSFNLKEKREQLGITQQEMSELMDIPLRTIENWESGKRTPNNWTIKLIEWFLQSSPSYQGRLITKTKGKYTIEQIKQLLIPIIKNYPINQMILFGSYAKGTATEKSDIDLVVDMSIIGLNFFGLLEDVQQALIKEVDLIHLSQIEENSPFMDDVKKGIILYARER